MSIRTTLCFILSCSTAFAGACETKRQVFIENAETKVWKTTICPNQNLPYHTHEYARVVIPAENGTLKVTYQSGKVSILHLKKQVPILLDKSQGSRLHQDVNTGKHSIHVTVIELRK